MGAVLLSAALAFAGAVPAAFAADAPTAIVSGRSVTGMMAVATYSQEGYEVFSFEPRGAYERNIQWAGRQSLIDQLAAVDPALVDRFMQRVAQPLEKGSLHLSPQGRKVHPAPPVLPADPARVPANGSAMMDLPSNIQVEARVFEEVLAEYLRGRPNVVFVDGKLPPVSGPDGAGRFTVAGYGTPEWIVIAEGGNSPTARSLGIERAPMSPARRQVAGVVHHEGGGIMAKHVRIENGERLLTGTMARRGSGKTWVVMDVASGVSFEPAAEKGLLPGTPAYEAASQDLKNAYFRRAAAQAMELTTEQISRIRLSGPFDGSRGPSVFTLQQSVSARATVGTNVLLFGDAVGNAHWSVGGGMQIGAVSHTERLRKLLRASRVPGAAPMALRTYASGVTSDTIAWGRQGISDFYMASAWQESAGHFDEAIRLWQAGVVSSPLEAMDMFMPREAAALVPGAPVPSGCVDALRRFIKAP